MLSDCARIERKWAPVRDHATSASLQPLTVHEITAVINAPISALGERWASTLYFRKSQRVKSKAYLRYNESGDGTVLVDRGYLMLDHDGKLILEHAKFNGGREYLVCEGRLIQAVAGLRERQACRHVAELPALPALKRVHHYAVAFCRNQQDRSKFVLPMKRAREWVQQNFGQVASECGVTAEEVFGWCEWSKGSGG